MFVLTSNIVIGPYSNVKVHEVKVSKSMLDFVDKAVLKIPITGRVKIKDQVISESRETAKLFEEGAPVVLNLGYNGNLKTEFKGFVSRVNFSTPLEIECEGYSYLLRKKSYLKSFKKTTLREVLQFLVEETEIILDKNIPDVPIPKWLIDQKSGTEVLDELKKQLRVNIFFKENVLFAVYLYINAVQGRSATGEVKYRIGWNVIKDNNLKLRQAKNQEVIVKYVSEKKDGTKITVQHGKHTKKVDRKIKTTGAAGTSGETLVRKSHLIDDQETLKTMAKEDQSKLSYDGYEGKITAFLVPYCEPGYRAVLDDRKYPERGGNYIVESTEVTYGQGGARRVVEIGIKL